MSENSSKESGILFFSTWYVETNKLKNIRIDFDTIAATKNAGEVVKTLLTVHQDTGADFPSSNNLKDTIDLCDQFLQGRVDTVLLNKVKERAEQDLEAIKPFAAAFKHLDTGGGFGMPMVVMVFGYPKSLVSFIAEHTDELGLVTAIKQNSFSGIKKMVRDRFSILGKPAKVSPTARAETPPSPPTA